MRAAGGFLSVDVEKVGYLKCSGYYPGSNKKYLRFRSDSEGNREESAPRVRGLGWVGQVRIPMEHVEASWLQ